MKMFPADIWEYPIPKIGNFSFRFLGKTLDEIQTISGFIEEDDMPHLKEYFDTNIRDTWVALDKKGKAWQSLKDVEPPAGAPD